MAWFENIKNAMHPYDDDYIENEERAAEEEFAEEEAPVQEESFEEKQPRPVFSRRESRTPPPPPAPEKSARTKMLMAIPIEFEDTIEIADSIKSRQAVLVNLEKTDRDTARRMVDFLSGVTYALGGRIMRVSDKACIATPANVDLVGDAVEDFENSGLYF